MARIKEQLRKKRRKKKIYTVVAGCLACVAIAAGSYLISYYISLHKQETAFENLRVTEKEELETESEKMLENTIENTTEEVILCESIYDFEQLKETNEDIYAWITIPGTQVDYPVLQSEEDDYYLDKNLDHSTGYPGCIYTNQCNRKSFDDLNTILYGHNMKNDSMFGSLHDYEAEENFETNRMIYVYTEEKRLTYEIVVAVKFTDVYIPEVYGTVSTSGNEQFMVDLKENAQRYSTVSHILEREVLPEEKLITLSTCISGESSKRYIIVGVLTEEAGYF